MASAASTGNEKPGSICAVTARSLIPVIVSKIVRGLLVVHLLAALRLLGAGDELAARVIILANSRQPESVQLAQFYAANRGVPKANVIALPLPETEIITWREFIDQVYRPLQDELCHRGWIDGTASSLRDRLGRSRYAMTGHHISYLVVCRGVPLGIANDVTLLDENIGRRVGRMLYKDEASVDSELSLLAQSGYEITGTIPNPFFGKEQVSALDAGTVVKVSRLDGPSFEIARQLVTSALEAERTGLLGRYYVDLQGPHPDGDKWLAATLRELGELNFDGDVERTASTFDQAARFDAPVLYFGWYANNLNGPFAVPGFKFPPGAIALHIHSFSARTLHSDSQAWCGPFLARGVTATVGNVFEPYLQLTHRPDLLLYALGKGKNFGDAAYFALPVLSWQAVAIGDPLYRPFKVSLEQQGRQLDQLPSALTPYVLIRRANQFLRQGKTMDAWNLLRSGLRDHPGLVLALACAKVAIAANATPTGLDALVPVDSWGEFKPEDWALAREMAGLLAAHEARPAAVQVYLKLAKTKAPSPAAGKALLTEARTVAQAAGDSASAGEFLRQLAELNPSPAAK
jgi:uncharacterized protein (TIGR03790 family)